MFWIILASIATVVLLLLVIPIRLIVSLGRDEIKAKISIFFLINKQLYPLSDKPKKKKSKRKSKAEIKSKTPDTKSPQKGALQQLREYRALISSIIMRMPRTFSLKIKHLRIIVASDDAAKTALLYGTVSSSLAFTVEWLDRHLVKIKKPRKHAAILQADFSSGSFSADADLHLETSLVRVLRLFIKTVLPHFLKRLLKRTAKKHAQRKEQSNVRG